MRSPRVPSFLALAFACVLSVTWASSASADASSDVDKGRNAYLSRQYDEADARFKAMLDPKTGSVKEPALVSEALMLWGAVKVAQRKTAEASQLFEQLLTRDPQYDPDPLSFPTEVLDVFSDTRHRIRERLTAVARETARLEAQRRARDEADKKREAERVARLEQLAGEETVRLPRNRFVAFIPFGAGQFQNGDKVMGWGFLAAEAAFVAVGTAVVPFAIAERRAMNEAYEPSLRPDATAQALAHRENALRLQVVNAVAYGAFAVTAIAGIVQANLVFVPETVRIQKRDPSTMQPPPAAPSTSPNRGGGSGTSNEAPAKKQKAWLVWPSVAAAGAGSGLTAGLEGRW